MNWNFHSLLGSEEWGRPYHFVDNTVGSGVHLSQSHFFWTLVRQCCPQNAFHQAGMAGLSAVYKTVEPTSSVYQLHSLLLSRQVFMLPNPQNQDFRAR